MTIIRNLQGLTPQSAITSPVELAQQLRELCGADGYRIEGGTVLALRWDLDGNEVIIERYPFTAVNG